MTYAEIGTILGLSQEAVRKIEKRALEKLKRFENRFKFQDIKDTMCVLSTPINYTNGGTRL